MKVKSVKRLLELAQKGELPKDFELVIDNDSVYGGGNWNEETEEYDLELDFDLDPREFLISTLKQLGIKAVRP